MTLPQNGFRLTLFFLFFVLVCQAQTLSLPFNPTVGSCYKVEIITDTYYDMELDFASQTSLVSNTQSYSLYSFTTLECRDEGYHISFACDSSSYSMSTGVDSFAGFQPGGYNSQTNNNFLLGKTLLLFVSKQGKILDIQGIEELVSSFPSIPSGFNITKMLTNKIKEYVRLVIPENAPSSLSVGQTWYCDENENIGQYQLIAFNDVFADLLFRRTIIPEENDDPIELMGITMKTKESGSMEGTLKVNVKTGWVMESVWEKNVITEIKAGNLSTIMRDMLRKEKITVKEVGR